MFDALDRQSDNLTKSVIAVFSALSVVGLIDMAGASDDGGARLFRLEQMNAAAPGKRELRRAEPAAGAEVRRRVWSALVAHGQSGREAHRRSAPQTAAPVQVAGAERPAGRISIWQDATLRPGDAVMFSDGIHIFTGPKTLPHAAPDFAPLARAKGLDSRYVATLAALDQTGIAWHPLIVRK